MHTGSSLRAAAPALALALLCGCPQPETWDGPTFVAPLDGQTRVPVDLPLLVRTSTGLALPDDTPLPPDFIRVLDLRQGGFVPGVVERDGADVLFFPDEDWRPSWRYAWAVDRRPTPPRGPELALDAALEGEAVFATGSGLTLLDAVVDLGRGGLCVLFSQPLPFAGAVDLALSGVAVEEPAWSELDADTFDRASPLFEGDPGPSAVCFEGLTPAQDTPMRLSWGIHGPWQVTLERGDLGDRVEARRRMGLP